MAAPIGAAIAILVLSSGGVGLGLKGCSSSSVETAKYAEGSCYQMVSETEEEWESGTKLIVKVQKIGKKQYAYTFCSSYFAPTCEHTTHNKFQDETFRLFERMFPKEVECP